MPTSILHSTPCGHYHHFFSFILACSLKCQNNGTVTQWEWIVSPGVRALGTNIHDSAGFLRHAVPAIAREESASGRHTVLLLLVLFLVGVWCRLTELKDVLQGTLMWLRALQWRHGVWIKGILKFVWVWENLFSAHLIVALNTFISVSIQPKVSRTVLVHIEPSARRRNSLFATHTFHLFILFSTLHLKYLTAKLNLCICEISVVFFALLPPENVRQSVC